ncbi:MAG: hypothetical protein HN929_10370 [Chloroflexi bacterium]|jgi:hypothetical protein|nr:hypothetical protein [Chloroflexota bacterium]
MAKIADIVDMPRSWWIKVGAEVSDEIIDHTKNKGLDVQGRKFKPLDPEYAERKKSGDIRRVGAGNGEANLYATGDMLSDLNTKRATSKSVTIGWGLFESKKVVGNANNGRVITTRKRPLAKMVEKFLQKMIDKQTKRNIKKNDTITVHKLGK